MPGAARAASKQVTPPCSSSPQLTLHDSFEASGRVLMSPPSLSTERQAGSVTRHCVHVINRQRHALDVVLRATDIQPSRSGTEVFRFVDDGTYGVSSWLKLPRAVPVLPPGADLAIPYSISVPPAPPQGSNYGAVLVQVRPHAKRIDGKDQPVGVALQLAHLITVDVPGDIRRRGQVGGLSAPRFARSGDPIRLRATYRNRGTGTDNVAARFVIRSSLSGRKLLSRRADGGRALRGGSRTVGMTWKAPPFAGRFRPEVRIDSEAGSFTERYPAVWVVPPWWMAVLVACAVAIPFGIRRSLIGSDRSSRGAK